MARQQTSLRLSGNDKNAGRSKLRSPAVMKIKAKNRNRPNHNGFFFIGVVRVQSKHTSYLDRIMIVWYKIVPYIDRIQLSQLIYAGS